MQVQVKAKNFIYLNIISEIYTFLLKICNFFIFCLPLISYSAEQKYYIDKHLEDMHISSAAFYKAAIYNIIKDCRGSGLSAIYNTNSVSGSSQKALTLSRVEEIYNNTLTINKESNIKPILNILKENSDTLQLITGLLKTSSTNNSRYGGDLGIKVKEDSKNAFTKIKNNTKDDKHIIELNSDIAKIYGIINNGILPFNLLIEYTEFQELISRVIHNKKHIKSDFFAKEDASLKIIIDFLNKDFVQNLPKITQTQDLKPINETATNLIKKIEKELYYSLNKNTSNKIEFIKYFLFHVEKICQIVSNSNQSINELSKLIPNTAVSASRVSMDVAEMVESNIKKRLLYIQNNNIKHDIFSSNMWLQPGYIHSKNNSKVLINNFTSQSVGVCLGIEDTWYNKSNINLGISYCYAHSKIEANSQYNTNLTSSSNVISGYFSISYYNIISDMQINYILSKNTRLRIDPARYIYNSSYQNSALSVEISTSKNFTLDSNFVIHPKIACSFSQYKTNPYAEKSGALLFNIQPNTHYNLTIGLETTMYSSFSIYGIKINPELFFGVKFKLINPNKKFTISLYNDDYQIKETLQGKAQFKTGIGLLANLYGLNIRIDYNFKKESNINTHIINGNLSYFF